MKLWDEIFKKNWFREFWACLTTILHHLNTYEISIFEKSEKLRFLCIFRASAFEIFFSELFLTHKDVKTYRGHFRSYNTPKVTTPNIKLIFRFVGFSLIKTLRKSENPKICGFLTLLKAFAGSPT